MNEDPLDQLLTKSITFGSISRHYVKSVLFKVWHYKTILVGSTLLILIAVSCRDAPKDTQRSDSRTETSKSCSQLPGQFQSYEEAESRITSASFQFQDDVNTSKSSWIRVASYYSCDGQTGYFMLMTNKKNYIFQGMPLSIWQGFKNADSFGDYYHAHIRDRYYMYVGEK